MKTASVTIGGEEYQLKPLVFAQMKKIWPYLKSHMNQPEVNLEGKSAEELAEIAMTAEMKAAEDAIQILAVALRDPEKDAEWVEGNLLTSEIPGLQPAMLELLQISGLVPEGNGLKELDDMIAQFQDKKASTETSTS